MKDEVCPYCGWDIFFPEYTEWNYVELKFRIRLTCIICDKVVDPIPTEEYKCINRTKLIDEMLDV